LPLAGALRTGRLAARFTTGFAAFFSCAAIDLASLSTSLTSLPSAFCSVASCFFCEARLAFAAGLRFLFRISGTGTLGMDRTTLSTNLSESDIAAPFCFLRCDAVHCPRPVHPRAQSAGIALAVRHRLRRLDHLGDARQC